jgi:phage replication-related protein YjqB (UPF0714/DUF867 family)
VDSLKIRKLSYEFPPVDGGCSKVAFDDLASSLADMGHSADIVTRKSKNLPKHEEAMKKTDQRQGIVQKKLGSAARARLEQNFGWNSVANNWPATYRAPIEQNV